MDLGTHPTAGLDKQNSISEPETAHTKAIAASEIGEHVTKPRSTLQPNIPLDVVIAAIRIKLFDSQGDPTAISTTGSILQGAAEHDEGDRSEEERRIASYKSLGPSIAIAVGNALQDLDSAVEWFVYRRQGGCMNPAEARSVLLNIVARPGIVAREESLDD